MADASVPKVNRRTLLKGSAAVAAAGAVGAAGLGVGNYWLGRGSHVSRSLGKKVIVIGVDGMDPRLSESMMKAGLLPNLEKLRAGGGFSSLGTSTPPQSPGRLGQLHQRCGARLARDLRLHPPPPARTVRPFLLGRRDPTRRRVLGGGRPPAPARLLAV